MALGFYTNWSDQDTSGYSSLFRPPSPELPPELFAFNEPSSLYDDYNINQLFDPNYNNKTLDYFPTCNPDLFPPVTPAAAAGGHVFTPSPEFQVSTFPYKDPYLHHVPYSTTFNHHHHHHLSHFFTAAPPLQPLETYEGGGGGTTLCSWYGGKRGNGEDYKVEGRSGVEVIGKQKVGGGVGGGGVVRLSTQSMAARVRRRKISEKTQELGKLIPGGQKMNTAEMFQAAYKYIKFLQAQVGVLKLMDSIPEGEQVWGNEELIEALVTCTSMQEKLYTAEKCIVSKHFAETLAIT